MEKEVTNARFRRALNYLHKTAKDVKENTEFAGCFVLLASFDGCEQGELNKGYFYSIDENIPTNLLFKELVGNMYEDDPDCQEWLPNALMELVVEMQARKNRGL